MPELRSALDTAAPEFAENRASMIAALERVTDLSRTVLAAGGERYVARHRQRGKLLPRERIELLLDPDAPFLELAGAGRLGTTPPRRSARASSPGSAWSRASSA